MTTVGSVAQLWRYPVKSMAGEQLPTTSADDRGFHADRMWAVRDLELKAVTTARRLPQLLGCSARFITEPELGVGPGDIAHVSVTFPDDTEITTNDVERMNAHLSELVGKPVELIPLPPKSDLAAYRAPMQTKGDLRLQFDLGPNDPLPDLSMYPMHRIAAFAVLATPIGSFADTYPVHVLTTSSLREMAKQGGDFDVRRFRPNVLLETEGDSLLEDTWLGGTLTAGGLGLDVRIPTLRCSVPLRPQRDLAGDPAVVKAVSRNNNRCLGVYTEVAREGTISVGDVVEVDLPEPQSALRGTLGSLAHRLKRSAVLTGNRFLPS